MQIVKLWRVVLTTSLVSAAPRYFRSAEDARAVVRATGEQSTADVSVRYAVEDGDALFLVADQSEPVRAEA